ncbi:hypothetical protein BDR03DRAFT_971219 [Suillus americanus]|nr:hypothetical protein BDR03DRAFT_971219 [Suillus americanus]
MSQDLSKWYGVKTETRELRILTLTRIGRPFITTSFLLLVLPSPSALCLSFVSFRRYSRSVSCCIIRSYLYLQPDRHARQLPCADIVIVYLEERRCFLV